MGWFQNVSDALYKSLCASFRLDPTSADAMKRFVPAYLFQATTPQANRDDNVCYYDIRPGNEPGFRYTETKYADKDAQEANATIQKNIPITVLLTFYGPNADDDSEYYWGLCQSDLDNTSPRSVLRTYQIVISGRPEFPVGLDEREGTFIRRRCDVRLNLVLYDSHLIPYSTVERVPDILIRPDTVTIPDNGTNSGNNEGNNTGDNDPYPWIVPQY